MAAFSVALGSRRVILIAGRRPINSAVTTATLPVNPGTRASIERARGIGPPLPEANCRSSRPLTCAITSPNAAPVTDSNNLSVGNWRANRPRPAPSTPSRMMANRPRLNSSDRWIRSSSARGWITISGFIAWTTVLAGATIPAGGTEVLRTKVMPGWACRANATYDTGIGSDAAKCRTSLTTPTTVSHRE